MERRNSPDGAGSRSHHEGLCVDAVRAGAHAAQQRSPGDPRRCHEDVISCDEIVRRENTIEVEAGVEERCALTVVPWPEPPLDRPAEAVASLQRAIDLGYAEEKLGDLATTTAYEKAAVANSRLALALNNLGVLYERQGAREKAIEAYHRALAADPKSADARRNLNRVVRGQG